MNQMDFIELDSVVVSRFVVQQYIASGNFASVYQSYDINNKNLVAIKIEKYDQRQYQISLRELDMMKALQKVTGIPKVIFFGKDQNYTYLVMQLLGLSLSDMLKEKEKLSLNLVCDIAIQLVKILAIVHSKFIVHRDIKPENIMFGMDNEKDLVYLVDFGISKTLNSQNLNQMQQPDQNPILKRKSFIGTLRYASVASHMGQEQGKKEDIESLGYVLIFLLKGKLPWQKSSGFNKFQQEQVGIQKQNIQLSKLSENLPTQFIKYFEHCRQLQTDENPDYIYLQQLFIEIQYNINQESQFQSQQVNDGQNQIPIIQKHQSQKIYQQQLNNDYQVNDGMDQSEQLINIKLQNVNSLKKNQNTLSPLQIQKDNKVKLLMFKNYLSTKQTQNSILQQSSEQNYNFIRQSLSGNSDQIKMNYLNEFNDLGQKMANYSSTPRIFKQFLP